MIGVVCSALAALSASLVARRQVRHRPIAAALLVALAYAVAAESGSSGDAPRLTLVLWGIAALVGSWAYLDAWGLVRAWVFPAALVGLLTGSALIFGDRSRWLLATWGPVGVLAACGIVGAGAYLLDAQRNRRSVQAYLRRGFDGDGAPILVRDLRLPSPITITQRIALALVASDVACLAFVPWPGVQCWQGRVSAIVVAGMQVWWLWKHWRRAK